MLFRSPVAIMGDISEMFLQVRLSPRDTKCHRFIWRETRASKDLIFFEWQRHVFGNKGSPTVAIFVAQYAAEKFSDSKPRAVDTIRCSSIVDDYIY